MSLLGAIRRRPYAVLLLCLTAAGLGLRLALAGAESIWLDEWVAMEHAGRSVSQLWTALGSDTHPPAYFLLLKAWIAAFGSSEVAVRSLSAVFGAAAIPSLYALVTEIAGRRAGVIAAVLLTISPFHIEYSQEARNYALFFLLSVVSTHAFWRVLIRRSGRWWYAWYFLVTILLLYTHLFAAFVLLAQAAYAATQVRSRLRPEVIRLILGSAAALIVLVPLAVLTLRQVSVPFSPTFWVAKPTLRSLVSTLGVFAGDGTAAISARVGPLTLIAAALSLCALRPGPVRAWLDADGRPALGWLGSATLPVVMGIATVLVPFVFSVAVAPIYLYRTVIPGAAALLTLIAIEVVRVRKQWMRWVLVAGLVLLPLRALVEYYVVEGKEDWRSATRYVEAEAGRGATVFTGVRGLPIEYYATRNDIRFVTVRSRQDNGAPYLRGRIPADSEVWTVVSVLSLDQQSSITETVARSRNWDAVRSKRFAKVEVWRFSP